MGIRFDETNLRARMVGATHGVTDEEISSAAPFAQKALAGFRKLYESGEVGFPDLPKGGADIDEIRALATRLKGSYDTVCLVGIGGSALGAWALDCGLRGPHPVQSGGAPRLVILDNVDPELIGLALRTMKPKKTLVVAIAKSGATAETVATFLIVKSWLEAGVGAKRAKSQILIVTSEGRGDLKVLATQEKYPTFHLPNNVGGRFSVLSAVGILPAALIGADVRKLLKGAAAMTTLAWTDDFETNTPLRAATLHWLLIAKKKKPIQVAFPYSNRLWGTAFWFRQLWAESLGKKHNRAGKVIHAGQTPVAALGTTDQHSQVQLYMEGPNDKVFSFWAVAKAREDVKVPDTKPGLEGFDYLCGKSMAKLLDAERRSTEAALAENERPNCTFVLDKVDEEHLGAFFQLMEFETAFAGELMNINAFDQEGVELGKKFTFGLMGRKGAQHQEFRDRFAGYETRRKG
ncbi:MAG: glucose-6-phosphate isomerase [Acidobacteria bacterium]|nr:glucose-6-phosphate isomerase [Acidobacteriota bacterium]